MSNNINSQVDIKIPNDDIRLLDDGTVVIDNPEFADYIKTGLDDGEEGLVNLGNCGGCGG